MIAISETLSIKTIRRNCLECSGDSLKAVMWCTCDGVNSTSCEFWPFRMGQKPETFRRRHGPWLLTPECMPSSDVELETLPNSPAEAVAYFRERFPGIEWDGPTKREMTPAQREAQQRATERLARMNATRKQASGKAQEMPSDETSTGDLLGAAPGSPR